jgi:ribosomal protein S18 acetylase RimI-like enzyme
MVIRDARPGEMPEIGDLRVAAYQRGGHLSPDSEYVPRLRELGADGDGDVLVAEINGRLAGTVMLQYPPHAGQVVQEVDEAEIRALAVAPEGQGRGVGRALVEAAIGHAVGRGVRHLVLCTLPGMRTAHRIYEAAGFHRLPDRDWAPGGDTLLVYGLRLPAAEAAGG